MKCNPTKQTTKKPNTNKENKTKHTTLYLHYLLQDGWWSYVSHHAVQNMVGHLFEIWKSLQQDL